MDFTSNCPVLEIKREGDILSFDLKIKNTNVLGDLKLNADMMRSISADIDRVMQSCGKNHRGHREVALEDRPVIGSVDAFSILTMKILPNAIQQEIIELAGNFDHLLIRTDELALPWEMLEFSDLYCPFCKKKVQPAVCPDCRRTQMPQQTTDCICGSLKAAAIKNWSHECDAPVIYQDMTVKPVLHMGLGFGLERIPLGYLKKEPQLQKEVTPKPLSILFIENPGGLYYTDRELRDLRGFIEKNEHIVHAHILDRENATKASIRRALEKAGPFDIVHFVGHGVFLPDRPDDSYLSLAGSEKLKLYEIEPLFKDHAPQIAILNGCQTGIVVDSDGRKIGFPLAFLQAGSSSVIGTLSTVADSQACYLMLYLYHEILQGVPLSQALLFAKRKITKKEFLLEEDAEKNYIATSQTGFMYSWSSYVIYGDGMLRPRHFPDIYTWRGFAESAQEALNNTIARIYSTSQREGWQQTEYASRLDIPDDYFADQEHPIFAALETTNENLIQSALSMAATGRHIIGLFDVTTLQPEMDLEELISERMLRSREELRTLMPFIQQMTTNESVMLIYLVGLDQCSSPQTILEQVYDISRSTKNAIHFILDGSSSLWASIQAVQHEKIAKLVYNRSELLSRTTSILMAGLRDWAQAISLSQIQAVAKDKWDPSKSNQYVPRRNIEKQIEGFLKRDQIETRGFCVLGETGRGKTNLLCRLYSLYNVTSASHPRVTVFSSANGLNDKLQAGQTLTSYIQKSLTYIFLRQYSQSEAISEDQFESALQIMQKEVDGANVEIVFFIDAINELSNDRIPTFVQELCALLDHFKAYAAHGLYLSVLVSSRAFSWRTIWSGREIDHQKYFPNLVSEGGKIEENLFDFDLSTEACIAYERTGLQPSWELLSDELKDLFRTPFFLQIVQTIAKTGGEGKIAGSYNDVMKHYEDTVLLRRGGNWDSVKKSELREAVLQTMLSYLAGDGMGESGETNLPQEIRASDVIRRLTDHPEVTVEHTIFELCEENVLETRGSYLRFAFDLFFDYLFRGYIIRQFNNTPATLQQQAWIKTVERFYRSEYHRHGLSAALANEFSRSIEIATHTKLLVALLDPEKQSQNSPAYKQLIKDAVTAFGEGQPGLMAILLANYYERVPDAEIVTEIACVVIASPRLHREAKEDLIMLVERILKDYMTGSQGAQDRRMLRNLINIVGGLGKNENGLQLVIDMVGSLIGIDYLSGELPQTFTTIFEIFLDPGFQKLFSKILPKSIQNFKESDGRLRVMLKVALASLRFPLELIHILFQPKYFKLLQYGGDTLRRIEIGVEIIIKGLLLWYTEQRDMGEVLFKRSLETIDTFLRYSLLSPLVARLNHPDTTQEYKQQIIENFGYFFLVAGWPLFKRLFSYSERGLDYLSEALSKGRGEDLGELLTLLDIQTPMSKIPEARQRLYNLYLEPDAFQNYLGMLATIVQGTADFSQVRDMLWDLYTRKFPGEFINGHAGPVSKEALISREVFSILTYMLRRTSQIHKSQLPELTEFVEKVVEHFFSFNLHDSEPTTFLKAFQNLELLGQEDPFNPLLPLGVAAQIQGDSRLKLGQHPNYLIQIIDHFYNSKLRIRLRLIDRALHELVPMSYFAPLVVQGSLQDIILNRQPMIQSEAQIRSSLVDVLKSLDLLNKGSVASMFEYLENNVQEQRQEDPRAVEENLAYLNALKIDAFSKSLPLDQIEYLYQSIDVFGGHDIITTAFIDFVKARENLVPFISQQITEVNTASQLVFGVITTILSVLASPEINFSISKLIYENKQFKL